MVTSLLQCSFNRNIPNLLGLKVSLYLLFNLKLIILTFRSYSIGGHWEFNRNKNIEIIHFAFQFPNISEKVDHVAQTTWEMQRVINLRIR